jgi:cysteine sulfinate desulfinase/cysteine desulfurase-like protein
VIDDSLAKTAELLNVSEEELILTSGASEANNLAVKALAEGNPA